MSNRLHTITLAAGAYDTIHDSARSIMLASNTAATDVHVAVGSGTLKAWPVGYRYTEDKGGFFPHIRLYNPSVGAMTITFWLSMGIIENDGTIVTGTVTVDPAANVITTPAAVVALPVAPELIDNAAAVNVGGGVVGIPVTGQPFATGEDVIIANTVNYNGTYPVLASSGANQVDITETYNAETFDGVDDSIVLATPRSIAANTARRELELHNHDAAIDLYFGDANVDPDNNRGIPVTPGNGEIISSQAQIYVAAPTVAGWTGVTLSYAEHTKA